MIKIIIIAAATVATSVRITVIVVTKITISIMRATETL